jgi:DNA-binding response OmpR family regulator
MSARPPRAMPRDAKRILVVDDEPRMIGFIRMNLELEGYQVLEAHTGLDALEMIRTQLPDLVLLDVMMPELDGFETLRMLREFSNVPVIMLTAKGEEDDKVYGLELGADDYVTKPFGLRELMARVKAVLRRHEQTGEAETTEEAMIGNVEVNFTAYSATKGGRPVAMTPREIEILKYFWKHRNETVSRDKLLTDVWGYDDSVSTRTVDNFILKLRQKVEDDPANPRHIITIHGVGYKLLA